VRSCQHQQHSLNCRTRCRITDVISNSVASNNRIVLNIFRIANVAPLTLRFRSERRVGCGAWVWLVKFRLAIGRRVHWRSLLGLYVFVDWLFSQKDERRGVELCNGDVEFVRSGIETHVYDVHGRLKRFIL